ncbi:protein MEMO1 isoform X5 [Rattus norvegicus]|uniref:protein MEMO1 isoform X5 n=1 Tax=Rattus norvegicus TaxID=10116 RepID=UPI0013F303F9|nr:protein MEMO1 isoform X2 [Rattus rattus]XP_032772716.1 protein MEMO1 isoform X2 [Rattus rattus]XP_038967831.1 protein MEMO1 isoform X4 [Rattus norvegicus]
MQDIRTVGLVLPMLTNKWIHQLPGEFSSLGPPIMCPCLDVHSPVWIYIGLLCMTFVLTKRFTESYGRQECLNECLCRQMKMNTVLKCICLTQLKPWKGQRFRYSYYDESQGEIYRSIEHLDKMGMSIIEQLDPVSFSNYLKKYHNTICGRHPIGVLLNAITELQKSGMNMSFSFLNYAQSSQCRSWQDSSVSYAAGALTVH